MLKKKNIYLILADENLFHPYYLLGLQEVIDSKKYHIIGVTIAKDTHKKGIWYFISWQFLLWGPIGFFLLGLWTCIQLIFEKMHYKKRVTIKSVCVNFRIPIFTSYNVNSEKHIAYLKKKNIDVIVSSCGHIFKHDLLSIPKAGCINRHTALLPAYGGVLPVFRAMEQKEKYFGVSIHFMKQRIDEGDILSQIKLPIKPKHSLFHNYVDGFYESIAATQIAIDNLFMDKIALKYNPKMRSYYSFPSKQEFIRFRKEHRTMTVQDIFYFMTRFSSLKKKFTAHL